ncbi:hypothetical protein HBI76_110600 [Parastagonospora nodorum]|nr:hypothetical protein HBI76_110600 [Parastagonospora nodorum]
MTKENALTMTLIKDNDDLLGTVNSHIKSRRLRAVMLLCQTTKLLGNSNKDRPLLKRYKTEAADSRYAKASRGRTKKDKDSEDSNTSSDVLRLRRRDRAAARAQLAKRKRPLDSDDYRLDSSLDINSKDNSEDEEATTAKNLLTTIYPANKQTRTRDSLSARVGTAIEHYAYILYFKELLSNNSRIFANAISIGKTQAITEVQNAQAEGNAIEHNAVNNNDKLYPTKGERTFYCADPLALQFCFFSNFPPENIGRLTKEEAIEMQINTTNAISKALAAANKLVALQSYVLGGFIIVYSFRKVDKHVFRAYNTISVTAQRTIIRKGGPYIEKRAILLPSYITFNATNKRDFVTSDRIYKIEDAVYQSIRNIITNIKHNASKHESSYKYKELISQGAAVAQRDILKKEGLNKLEASRRVIFNRFEMQAIASYPALATLKAAQFKIYSSRKVKRFTLNSVKDLFTNLSKDYFLVREARAITKSSLKFQNLSNLCSKIIVALIVFAEAITLTEATHVVIIEPQDSIVYFNLDSELELKVLSKQNVKTTF